MESTVLPVKPSEKPTKFTPMVAGTDRAKQIARLGVEKRLANQAQAKEAKLGTVQPDEPALDAFMARRLMRIREQLDLIDVEVKRCLLSDDPADHTKVKMLVESSSRLSEQERFTANRPGPGTRKPKPERSTRERSNLDIDDVPQ